MDFSDFSDPGFDAKNWINKTLSSASGEDGKDKTASSCATKLQIHWHQLNGEMEALGLHVVQALPRVIRDVEILTEEALVLKEKMDSVKEEIIKVEQNTGQSMKSLEKIDRIKTELLKAKQALHEADNWTILSTDVEAAFKANDIESVAIKLVSMRQSLSVLVNAPAYDKKKLKLEEFENRLEEVISPLFIQSFTARSVDSSKEIVRIFIAINKLKELMNYYSKTQEDYLLNKWDEQLQVDTENGVLDSIQSYYDSLVTNWNEQIKWCDHVFPFTPFEVLIKIYTDVLNKMSSKFSSKIKVVLKNLGDPIVFLNSLKLQSKQFAENLENMIERSDYEAKNQELFAVAKSIYLPYVQHITKYGTYEKAVLHQGSGIFKENIDDLLDSIPQLITINSHVFQVSTSIKKRCKDLSENVSIPGLCTALEYLFHLCLERYKYIMSRITELKNKSEDLNMFQMCLTCLQSLGDFINNMKQLDVEITDSLIQLDVNLNKSDISSFTKWDKLLLNESGQKELRDYFKNLKKEKSLFPTTNSVLGRLCKEIHETTFDIIFAPISEQLELLKNAPMWTKTSVSSDLPDYSFVPQEYMTQIGQYLISLPQHLEPFLVDDNPAVTVAMSVISSDFDKKSDNVSFADLFLSNITNTICKYFCDLILKIDELSPFACKQIAADVEYLGHVLEDLGFSLTNSLQKIVYLLKLSENEYVAKSEGYDLQLVSAVRRLRNITPK